VMKPCAAICRLPRPPKKRVRSFEIRAAAWPGVHPNLSHGPDGTGNGYSGRKGGAIHAVLRFGTGLFGPVTQAVGSGPIVSPHCTEWRWHLACSASWTNGCQI
jgi:hypothetical protein